MDAHAFEHHLNSPQGRDHRPPGCASATASGYACCDEVTISVRVAGDRIADAGFGAYGCGAATAAASAAVALLRGARLLDAARIGSAQINAELGGLSAAKLHAADLTADALARALGQATRAHAALPARAGATLVAMSGGVDSAVAAHLCAADGEAVAITLQLWSDPVNDAERSCCSATAVSQARSLAHSMGLAHFTLDLRDEFRAGVVEPFIAGYARGETPNPCVGCNGHVRLDAMLALAQRLGCAAGLATGHYARTAESDDARGPLLRAAADPGKDQTYMLAALDPASLARMRFPLGELRKPQVRTIAASAGLPVADKADSQDLCFLAGTTRADFMVRHGGVTDRPGELVDVRGAVLGHHSGQHRFTVGQRRGLGIAGGRPLYVLARDPGSGRVIVGSRERLQADRVAVRGASLRREGARVDRVKLRYRSAALRARLAGSPGAGRHRSLELQLSEPADGPAPGQLACLMDGDLIVGWGTIDRPLAPLGGAG
ncbi:MAG: tRNA 2-thiouridine(34) synthase MnmA [Solirubrobacteraceae bacterium]